MASWFETGNTAPLDMLGATMGRGVNPAGTGMSTGMTQDMVGRFLAGQKAEADRAYSLQRDELDQRYDIAKLNARTSEQRNAIDKWYQQEQVKIARERITEEARQFDLTQVLSREQFGLTHGLNQAKLGYDLLAQAAQLRGPENYYQAANYARGVSGNPETATFLAALQNNARLAGFGAQGGLPDKETMGTLAAKLQGGGNAQADNNLATIANIAAKGAHQIGAGGLEQLTDTERKLLGSGLDELGIDTPTFLQNYARSRVGNRYGNAA